MSDSDRGCYYGELLLFARPRKRVVASYTLPEAEMIDLLREHAQSTCVTERQMPTPHRT